MILPGLLIFLGYFVRLSYVLGATSPLNDGGFFYAIVRDIEQAKYGLPLVATYNDAAIPLVYPPLGFYIVAIIDRLTPWELLTIFHFLPLILSVPIMIAFWRLSLSILGEGVASVAALGAFALLPMSYLWNIMGGGITRAFGLLFALLYLEQIIRLYKDGQERHAYFATVFATGIILSHPEAAWFAVYSSVVCFLWLSRSRRGLAQSIGVAVGAALLSAPWWVLMLCRHGNALLRAFGDSGFPWYQGIEQLLTYKVSSEPFFPWLSALSLLGIIACVARRQWFIPCWLAATFILQARAGDQKAIIPLALLGGVGFERAMALLLTSRLQSASDVDHRPRNGRMAIAAAALLVLLTMFSALSGFHNSLVGLSAADRSAMEWVASNTPPASRVLVLSSARWFGEDRVSEWFPSLSQRQSVTTVQGYEWLGQFSARIARYNAAQYCFTEGPLCVNTWSRQYGVEFDYVFIAPTEAGTGATPAVGFAQDPHYRRVFESKSATIYQIRDTPLSGPSNSVEIRR